MIYRLYDRVGCVFSIVVISMLPYAEFEQSDPRKDAPRFIGGVRSRPEIKINRIYIIDIAWATY